MVHVMTVGNDADGIRLVARRGSYFIGRLRIFILLSLLLQGFQYITTGKCLSIICTKFYKSIVSNIPTNQIVTSYCSCPYIFTYYSGNLSKKYHRKQMFKDKVSVFEEFRIYKISF